MIHEEFISELIDTYKPKPDKNVYMGLAYSQRHLILQEIDQYLRVGQNDFPPGLEYIEVLPCHPAEAYAQITRKRSVNNKVTQTYNVATSSVWTVKLMFRWQGEVLDPCYLDLPIIKPGSIMYIWGVPYEIPPVVTDRTFSVTRNGLFLKLPRTKLNFSRHIHHIYCNGKTLSRPVIYSKIYQKTVPGAKVPTIAHYLFAEFGVTEAFKRLANVDVVLGTYRDITTEKYPDSEYFICQSLGIKPAGVRGKGYTASGIMLAIRKEYWTPLVEGMVMALFFAIDCFPQRITLEDIDSTRQWQILLGVLITPNDRGEGKMLAQVDAHMSSLRSYVDTIAHEELAADNVFVNDFWELLAYVIGDMNDRIKRSNADLPSTYGKQLRVLRYISEPITSQIFNFVFEISKLKLNKGELKRSDIIDQIRDKLKQSLIFNLRKGSGVVKSVQTSSTNMWLGITSNCVRQQDATPSKTSNKNAGNSGKIDRANYLHASLAETNSPFKIPKSETSGRSELNIYVKVNPETGVIERKEHLIPIINKAQNDINR